MVYILPFFLGSDNSRTTTPQKIPPNEEGLLWEPSAEFRATRLSRRKETKRPSLEAFCLFSCVEGRKGPPKNLRQTLVSSDTRVSLIKVLPKRSFAGMARGWRSPLVALSRDLRASLVKDPYSAIPQRHPNKLRYPILCRAPLL